MSKSSKATDSPDSQIKCPNCGSIIDVQDIISHQLEEKYKNKYQEDIASEKQRFSREEARLQKERADFEERKRKEAEQFEQQIEERLKKDRASMEKRLSSKIKEEQEERLSLLEEELKEKSEQVKDLNRQKAEIERLKREKDELREVIEAETQKRISETLQSEKEKIKHIEEEKSEFKIKELQKQLEDQRKLTEEMKRKQEQGSMQLQGEVQEMAIEEWLMAQFPMDSIEEIKKGARGADCLQIVNTHNRQQCGRIYYESKRTKDFHATWIPKFKADMLDKSADIGVLVSEARPPGMERLGMIEGVYVCSFAEFKALCIVLRQSLIQISDAVSSQENKGDKMIMLYDFLTSNSFRMQIEAIVEGFSAMKSALDNERRAMHRIWKEREKQIEKVICNTSEMYGSIKGIAGTAIQSVSALELPASALDDEEYDEE